MRKTTKGALAASAAGVLLLGGAGSLAYWTAESSAPGGSITAGTLTLTTPGTCDGWKYSTGSAGAGTTVNRFVPGDKVTNTCTFTIGATGDNLRATLDAPTDLTLPGDETFQATVATAYAIDGVAVPTPGARKVTSADDGDDLTVTFNVTIPHGDDGETGTVNTNNTQGITAALDSLTVTLTQDNPNP